MSVINANLQVQIIGEFTAKGGIRKGMGELHALAKRWGHDRWANAFRDAFALEWAKTAKRMIRQAYHARKFDPNTPTTLKIKERHGDSQLTLRATGTDQLTNALEVIKGSSVGTYAVMYRDEMASTPYGGAPIHISSLAVILNEGASPGGYGGDGIVARPFFSQGMSAAARKMQSDSGMSRAIFKTFFSDDTQIFSVEREDA